VEIGCNTVLNPGTVIGRNATIYPLSRVRGMIPAGHIYKSETQIVPKQEK
jgi:acetyltransferase-like isoleucine patch superfamily enzyme